MTIAERVPESNWLAPTIPVPRGPVVMDTSEVRWFAPGPVPRDVLSWFAELSTISSVDERTDRYLLHGIPGLGVKYRGQRVLEVKRRKSIGADIALGDGLSSEVVRWQKWQPVELDDAWSTPDVGHLDVHKAVLKSSVAWIDGAVVPIDQQSDSTTPHCSIELASVVVEGATSWTLGFEASGPVEARRHVLLDSWRAVSDGAFRAVELARYFDAAAAYPDWLERHLPHPLAV